MIPIKRSILIPVCAWLLWRGVDALAQQVVQFPVPAPEGKAVSFNLAPDPRSPLMCLGVSDSLLGTGSYEYWWRGLLYYCTVEDNGTASSMVVLDTSMRVSGFMYAFEDRFSPVLATGAQGTAAVAWARQEGAWDDIAYPEMYREPTVRCAIIKEGKPSRVFESVRGDHPSACFDEAGDLHLVHEQVAFSPYTMTYIGSQYETYFFVTSRLLYRIIHTNGSMDSVLTIPRGFRPQLRIDGAGHRHLFWLEADSSNVPTFVLRYMRDPGSASEVSSVIAPSVRARGDRNFNRRPPAFSAFVDDAGCAYAAWSDVEEYNIGTLSVAWSSSGQQWTTMQRSGLGLSGRPGSFAVTPAGRIHVSWAEYWPGPESWTVSTAQGDAGSPLFLQSTPVPVSTMYPGNPVLALDSRDSVHLVFDDGGSGISYHRDLASTADSTIHLLFRSMLAVGIRGLPDDATRQTSVAFDATDQLWVVAAGDSGLSLLRLDRKATPVGPPVPARPFVTALAQNYPNPFNPSTIIPMTIAARQLCVVKVFDVLGREIATLMNEVKEPGRYVVRFNGAGLPSGVYYCRMTAGAFSETRRMVLIR